MSEDDAARSASCDPDQPQAEVTPPTPFSHSATIPSGWTRRSLFVLIAHDERTTRKLANALPEADGKAGAPGCAPTGSRQAAPSSRRSLAGRIMGCGPGRSERRWKAATSDPAMPPLGNPRHVLRVECIRCFRIVEIQKADAVRFYGPHAVWKDVGQRLLDQTCSNRTGRHEEDGCWPGWST